MLTVRDLLGLYEMLPRLPINGIHILRSEKPDEPQLGYGEVTVYSPNTGQTHSLALPYIRPEMYDGDEIERAYAHTNVKLEDLQEVAQVICDHLEAEGYTIEQLPYEQITGVTQEEDVHLQGGTCTRYPDGLAGCKPSGMWVVLVTPPEFDVGGYHTFKQGSTKAVFEAQILACLQAVHYRLTA